MREDEDALLGAGACPEVFEPLVIGTGALPLPLFEAVAFGGRDSLIGCGEVGTLTIQVVTLTIVVVLGTPTDGVEAAFSIGLEAAVDDWPDDEEPEVSEDGVLDTVGIVMASGIGFTDLELLALTSIVLAVVVGFDNSPAGSRGLSAMTTTEDVLCASFEVDDWLLLGICGPVGSTRMRLLLCPSSSTSNE